MISWNSQMALDARQHLFFHDEDPRGIWRVVDEEEKPFVIKLYEVTQGTNAVSEGRYLESKRLESADDDGFNPEGPEADTEWCYLEMPLENFLGRYKSVEELSPE